MFSSAENQHLETEILLFLKTVSHLKKKKKSLFFVYVQLIEKCLFLYELVIFFAVGFHVNSSVAKTERELS